MSTELSPENERFIADLVAAGNSNSRDEALDADVDLLKQQVSTLEAIDNGRRQLDSGEFHEYDDESLKLRLGQLKQDVGQHSQTAPEAK